jgi:hypothetical protein
MAPFVQYVRVDHGGADVPVTEQFLDCSDVIPRFKQMCGERMPEGVAPDMLDHSGHPNGLLDCPLKHRLVKMMPAFFASLGVRPAMFLRKDPLPAPVLRRVGVFPIESVRQWHSAPPLRHVLLVNGLDLLGWSWSGAFVDSGSMVIRAFALLPSQTRISFRDNSMSCTRRRRHSIRRSPAPYMSEAISHLSPLRFASTAYTSSRVITTGRRSGFLARMTSPRSPTSRPITTGRERVLPPTLGFVSRR